MKYLFFHSRLCCVLLAFGLAGCGGGGGGSGSSSPSPAPGPSIGQSSSASSTASSVVSGDLSTSGLEVRPSNKSCLAPAPVADSSALISWKPVFPKIGGTSRIAGLFQLPGDDQHWYLIRQTGFILKMDTQATTEKPITVLDIDAKVDSADNEMGLLGAAPHPNFITNRFVFLYYTARNNANQIETRVARYVVKNDGTFDRDSELLILSFTRPHSNHVGGHMAFDQQGYLYIASGDGGSAGDPQSMGQNLNVLLGKILRIDIDHTENGKNYAIPADNPFISTPNARPEIWAYGFRNPWRFSFDKTTNDLWVGDVGQDTWEEINLVTRGGNYGWGDMEGDSCFKGRPNCSTANKIKPVLPINQSSGACSVIGGYVYRGSAYPAAYGKYFYTDYCERTTRSITRASNGNIGLAEHGSLESSIVAFAQDNQGELYAVGGGAGGTQIYKMQASNANLQPGTMLDKLSQTGCVNTQKPKEASSGLIPYSVKSELWSDGAQKERYMSLPDSEKISLDTDGDFDFPVGAVLVKHFKFGEKFVETRLFTHSALGWQGFSYEWNDEQTDATLLKAAKDKTVNNVSWHFPSSVQCLECHTAAAGFSLGLEARQLNGNLIYPISQKLGNQLLTLEHIGIFPALLTPQEKTDTLFSLTDPAATTEQKARSYLHSNCSNCHQPGAPAPANMDLRYSTALAQMNICNAAPVSDSDPYARIVTAGDPSKSILVKRMQATDETRMPPLGRSAVDSEAVKVVSDWIASLANCN